MNNSASFSDPRHTYLATYKVNGSVVNEQIMALNSNDAENHLKQQLSLVGWTPVDIELKQID